MAGEITKSAVTVFYSWQSDLPNKLNRGFIQQALERAAKELRRDDTITVEPVIDRDTSDVAGAPDIGATIFAKIEQAAVLVCDVSIVSPSETSRSTPNPNVLIELGFGLHALGWSRIVLVMNEAYGGPSVLPFDLKMKRVMVYRAEDGASNAEQKVILQKKLEEALRLVLKETVDATPPKPAQVELAIQAVQAQRPDAPSEVRAFMKEVADHADRTKPAPGQPQPDEALVSSLTASLSFVADFARLSEVLSRVGSKDAALAVFSGFERIVAGYNFPPRQGGSYRETDFDFHKFIGHELFVTFVAALVRHDRWELLAEVLDELICVETNAGRRNENFTEISDYVGLLEHRSKRLKLQRVSLHADLLKERHTGGELAKLCPWQDFIEADYLLWLRSELAGEESPAAGLGLGMWRPWSMIHMERTEPRFLVRAERRNFADRLVRVLGLPSVDELRSRYAARAKNASRFYGSSSPFFRVVVVSAEKLGSK